MRLCCIVCVLCRVRRPMFLCACVCVCVCLCALADRIATLACASRSVPSGWCILGLPHRCTCVPYFQWISSAHPWLVVLIMSRISLRFLSHISLCGAWAGFCVHASMCTRLRRACTVRVFSLLFVFPVAVLRLQLAAGSIKFAGPAHHSLR